MTYKTMPERLTDVERSVSELRYAVQEIERSGLSGLVDDVRPLLKGYRTKLAGWLSTLPSVLTVGGMTVDPQATAQALQEHGWLVAGVQIALAAAVHRYRDKAGGKS